MENVLIVVVILLILGAATAYIVKEKKRGAVCIGCPHAGVCAQKRKGGCTCNTSFQASQSAEDEDALK